MSVCNRNVKVLTTFPRDLADIQAFSMPAGFVGHVQAGKAAGARLPLIATAHGGGEREWAKQQDRRDESDEVHSWRKCWVFGRKCGEAGQCFSFGREKALVSDT